MESDVLRTGYFRVYINAECPAWSWNCEVGNRAEGLVLIGDARRADVVMRADLDQVSCFRALGQVWPCISLKIAVRWLNPWSSPRLGCDSVSVRDVWLWATQTQMRFVVLRFPSVLLKHLSPHWKWVLLYPDDTLPLKYVFFLISKGKRGCEICIFFVNIYVLRIWIFSCLHQLSGRIFSFWMLCFWNETVFSYLSRLRAGLFSDLCFFFSTWLFKLCLGFSSLPLVFENMQMNWMLECFCVLGQWQCIFFQRKCNMYSF